MTLAALARPEVRLPESDRLSIFAKALHFEASRITGSVNLFRVWTEGVPFEKLKPLLSDFAAPTAANSFQEDDSTRIFAAFFLVVDSSHAVVETGYERDANAHGGAHTLVFVKKRGRWTINEPELSAADRNRLHTAAFIYLLGHKDNGFAHNYGYEHYRSYAAILERPRAGDVRLSWKSIDPPATLLAALAARIFPQICERNPISAAPGPSPAPHHLRCGQRDSSRLSARTCRAAPRTLLPGGRLQHRGGTVEV